ncbi:MAG: carbon-nitrogen hydrolase family protein [Candidatus Nitrosotenuis sp.]|uniref:Nitrilase/cyanide hydratase and apolipoprotein N-acyltransferase n=1 Tax=Candidatus Nitrosotenuis uzonensis TaxID=1407055 RepID=V6AR80_9ARCH|nr:carbon-nitrogen hydrolase family protein [Candidatus Nitrosotenuis uzonensis]CAE6492215.1 Nitrilase/cyanide hydratase and apolipoprotein N-acyltransferase [Candidatus Nitrosotenuis uzonensis]CDI04928.1 Nitrilase/cyanide hydratase and apolipoprotein N-acyltransferase [Candidatus Nitrosotenuis uzonensis]
MKVAVVQFRASTDKQKNLQRILNYVKESAHKGANLCAFPEFMMFYTTAKQSPAELAELAEPINGNFVNSIASEARKHSITVVGTLYEKSKKKTRVYDTSFIISPSGKLLSSYRKIHLYDALGFRESDKLEPGSKISLPIRTKVGKIGMMICYDLRFPEMSRILALSGSEILVVPSAWVQGEMKEEHWITINKTRAIENGCYVVAPDQVGNIYCGRSLVVDPYGKILLDMKKKQGVGIVDISLDRIKQTRKALPLLQSRRTDIYSNL